MTRALSFLVGRLRAEWHRLAGHDVKVRKVGGFTRSIYCDECNTFLWVRS